MATDEEYDCLTEAGKQWEFFQAKNNFRGISPKCCETCMHIEHQYEGERDCDHPDKYDKELLGGWSITSIDCLDLCDKWEAAP